ncbi:PAQR family membrane homeostasis protein TrhA [Vibrio hangzhouensis]|uniref:PAQR family membrane homeostasis protein TrhA n=1 Tax=Vibrio hangzhouensis TaxID=462991 RepID=UPI001C959331|nr:hemolysin III family protein [Vibrio hangzhouensis]MBY6199434.1 hemolysin III family protein [Vibrio hangzhouensis]
MSKPSPNYSQREEWANSITHGIGVLLSIIGLILLLDKSFLVNADTLTITSMSLYGGSMITLFLASTLYHSVPHPRSKRWLKTFDHCAIFLLIAGSYTPFMLVSLRTPLAVGLMAVIWSLAAIGIVMKLFFVYRYKRASLITYLVMGWLSLIVIYQLAKHLDSAGLILLALGGAIYTLGVVFYTNKRIPYNHAIWHLFVLGGAACHFFAVYWYVNPV